MKNSKKGNVQATPRPNLEKLNPAVLFIELKRVDHVVARLYGIANLPLHRDLGEEIVSLCKLQKVCKNGWTVGREQQWRELTKELSQGSITVISG